ncbi:MAG: iron complex outerrane recepter protein [Thermoanaerobaculia bacterium]|jgi:iron complex outermembrane receptor protein|nr:iron complex outerrane recepter protein [Thermoanaerobaculia bacterium]
MKSGTFVGRLSPLFTDPFRKNVLRVAIAAMLTLSGGSLRAQQSSDLTALSVDDLMNVEVTSVSRKGQKLSDTAAAVFVITQDDIRRSGATSIPEILRIVPGLDVARVNGNVWAISARGSSGQFANKLLVMIDGRSVYTPLFSGVFWDVQDTLLEDIDRIEVIRGPGGTLWGANAVNGIINIITKHAIETQGTLLSIGGGAVEGTATSARYGGAFGRHGNYRVYGKTFDRPSSAAGSGRTNDDWYSGRAGFRADWTSRGGDNFTAQGDVYRNTVSTLGLFDPTNAFADRETLNHVSGEILRFRWTSIQSSRSDTALQASYDHTNRSMLSFLYGRRTLDIDFQHHLKVGTWNDAVWGAAYRVVKDHADGSGLKLVRDSQVEALMSAFFQDEIQITRRLRATVGTKVIYEAGTVPFFQPTLRLLFKASDRQTIWAAATSAVRLPSEIEEDARVNVGAFPDGTATGGLIVLTGNPDLKAERVQSFEIGYRTQLTANATFDATAFYNRLRDIVHSAPSAPRRDSSGHTVIPINFSNDIKGHADGMEFLLTDSPSPRWNVSLGYAFFRGSSIVEGDPSSLFADVSSPHHQLQLRSFLQLPRQLELDSAAYYVGALGSNIKPYLRLDAQLVWHPANRWELSLSGQNLLHARHSEFAGTNGENELGTPVGRAVSGKITWRF